jgi:hypothetical protein
METARKAGGSRPPFSTAVLIAVLTIVGIAIGRLFGFF